MHKYLAGRNVGRRLSSIKGRTNEVPAPVAEPLTERPMNLGARSGSKPRTVGRQPATGDKENANVWNTCHTSRGCSFKTAARAAVEKEIKRTLRPESRNAVWVQEDGKDSADSHTQGQTTVTATATANESRCEPETSIPAMNLEMAANKLLDCFQRCCLAARFKRWARNSKAAVVPSAKVDVEQTVVPNPIGGNSKDKPKLRELAFYNTIDGLLKSALHKRFLVWNYKSQTGKSWSAVKMRILGRALSIVERRSAEEHMKAFFAYCRTGSGEGSDQSRSQPQEL